MQRDKHNEQARGQWTPAIIIALIFSMLSLANAASTVDVKCPQLDTALKHGRLRESTLIALSQQHEGVCTARAQQSLGYIYFSEHDYRQAFYWWKKSALHQNIHAQYNLGMLYQQGKGVGRDNAKALYWWQQAALQGDPLMQYRLAMVYLNGTLGKENSEQAVYWMQQAAARNFPAALRRLGYMYSHGVGVPINAEKSTQIYQRAAVLGDSISMYNIGLHYKIGFGVKPNAVMAAMWFKKALKYHMRCAANDLGVLYSTTSDGVKQNKPQAIAYFKYAMLMPSSHPDRVWQSKRMHYSQAEAEIYAQYMFAKWARHHVSLSARGVAFAEGVEQRFANMCWR